MSLKNRETLDTISGTCFMVCIFRGTFVLGYSSSEPAVELWLIIGLDAVRAWIVLAAKPVPIAPRSIGRLQTTSLTADGAQKIGRQRTDRSRRSISSRK